MRRPINQFDNRRPLLPKLFFWLVIIVLAFVIGTWQRRRQLITTEQATHSSASQPGGETANDSASGLSESTNNNGEQETSENNSVSGENKEEQSTVLKEVKRTTTKVEETKAVQLTNAFEMAFNQRSAANMTPLFADSKAVEAAIVKVSEANSYRPISFSFESIEVRGDSSVLVTVSEVRADDQNNKLTVRRLLELIPQNGVYKIGNYFTPNSTAAGSGFDKN